MKLKTLKDITKCEKRIGKEATICKNCGINHIFTEELLKKEAIKWIKKYRKEIQEHSHKKFNPQKSNYYMKTSHEVDCLSCRNKYVQMIWIKHFFNITEESELE